MTETAPATSKLLCACSSFDSGTYRSEKKNAAIPTGTLTKKIHGHESHSTSMPPTTRPDRAAADRDRRPDAERLRPLGPFPERRRDDRQRRGRHERRAEALGAARDDQPRLAVGEPAEQRRGREEDEPGEEDPLAADQVAGATAEQQEPAEQQRVRVDDPLEARLGEPELRLDRRERDVHDRRVEDHHELRQADEDQDEPRAHGVSADIHETTLHVWARRPPA